MEAFEKWVFPHDLQYAFKVSQTSALWIEKIYHCHSCYWKQACTSHQRIPAIESKVRQNWTLQTAGKVIPPQHRQRAHSFSDESWLPWKAISLICTAVHTRPSWAPFCHWEQWKHMSSMDEAIHLVLLKRTLGRHRLVRSELDKLTLDACCFCSHSKSKITSFFF